ncbi:TraM recognition domain-containing protein [Microbacterium sp. CGR1]|uniref:TraM recognition domain-containing protein n=1 Tax=Microbacterium sp. CGR1 TaxID=1696072 RepID=UPI003DA278E4
MGERWCRRRAACSPRQTTESTLDGLFFLAALIAAPKDTLYLFSRKAEDPRPPLVLPDEVENICRIPDWYSHCRGRGIMVVTILQIIRRSNGGCSDELVWGT